MIYNSAVINNYGELWWPHWTGSAILECINKTPQAVQRPELGGEKKVVATGNIFRKLRYPPMSITVTYNDCQWYDTL